MLSTLKIKNLAIIEHIEIDFESGLNIITGETGSGKTILVNSILLLMGKRFNISDIIRHGAENCEVEAIFEKNGREFILKRTVSINGKSKFYINDSLTTLNNLKDFVSSLVEFSAQNQNQILFDKIEQLKFFDIFGGIKDEVDEFKKEYNRFLNKLSNYNKKLEIINNSKQEKEFLKYQLEELENANLTDINEEEILKKDIELFENIETIKTILENATYEITESDNSLIKRVGELYNNFVRIKNYKSNFSNIINLLKDIEINLNEVYSLILNELPDVDNEINIDSLIERLEEIKKLKKKFNKETIGDLLFLKKEIVQKLGEYENFVVDIEKDKKELEELEKKILKMAEIISNKREKIKKLFESEVQKGLAELKMEKVKFEVSIKKLDKLNEYGKDEIEFFISTNPGEPLKPLNKIASGGELSRIMLTLKSILSDYLEIPILFFDEIDTGTSGDVSLAIGKKLKKISKKHQVFVITHLPQVAAFSDNHYRIIKKVINNKTYSTIEKLDANQKIEEIAKMITGSEISDTAIASAKEMINVAKTSKC